MFFNEDGIFDVDEIIVSNESFIKIMEDGIVTDDEVKAQSEKVIAMLRSVEVKYSKDQLTEIKNVIAEICVLNTIFNYNSLLNYK